MQLSAVISLLFMLCLMSCSNTSIPPDKRLPIELSRLQAEGLSFHYDEIELPHTVDGDVGIPAHKQGLWICKQPISALFNSSNITKGQLTSSIKNWNANIQKDHKKLRLPSTWEIEQYHRLNRKTLSVERYHRFKTHDVIRNDIYLVRTYLGKSSDTEF